MHPSAHPKQPARIRLSRTVSARVEALGISPSAVLQKARLPQDLLQQDKVFLTVEQWFALWESLASFIKDPAFGLHIPQATRGEPYEPLSITALSASSLHHALTKIARYKQLFGTEGMRMVQQGPLWRVEVVWLAIQAPPSPLLIDATLAHVIELGKHGTGEDVSPHHVFLQREELHREMYESHFQCPVTFGADCDAMMLSHEIMMRPFSTANPDLLSLIEPQLAQALEEQMVQPDFVDQVALLLRSRMAGEVPRLHQIARELHLSPRTLQRRLTDEGTPFQQLIERVRHDMAKEYLRASSLALTEIAFLLGYQEGSSFHRAFQRWEGQTPRQWRIEQH